MTTLRKLYLKRKIKRKKVRQEKYLPPQIRADYAKRCKALITALDEVKKQQRTIVYLDEVNFTKLSFQSKDWSGKNTNLAVD